MDIIDLERQEIESRLVSALLSDPLLILQTTLKPNNFKNIETRKIFKSISELVNRNVDVSLVSIAQEDKSLKITDLIEYQKDGNIYKNGFKPLEAQLHKQDKKDRIYAAIEKVTQMLSNGEEPEKMLNVFYEASLDESTKDDSFTDIGDIMQETLTDIEKNYKNGGGIIGMRSNYPKLDCMLNGFQKGMYIMLAARPSVGKTAFAINLIKRLAYKNNVLFFSLEMSEQQLGYRFLTSQSRLDGNRVRKGIVQGKEFDTLVNAAGQNTNLHLKIDDTSSLTVETLIRRIIKYKRLYGLDVVVIDYLTLLETEEHYSTDREKYNIISRKLRIMKDEQNICLICLAQLRRLDNEDREPTIQDLRETGNLEQDANIILLLHREKDAPIMQDGSQDLGLKIGKNRDGATGLLNFTFYKTQGRIEEQ